MRTTTRTSEQREGRPGHLYGLAKLGNPVSEKGWGQRVENRQGHGKGRQMSRGERGHETMKRILMVAVLLTALFLVGANSSREYIRLTKDDFLRLMISDAVREATGLWQDRVHWRIVIVNDTDKARNAWGLGETGKKTVVVAIDHPNGVAREKYRESYTVLEAQVKSAAESIIKRYALQDQYVAHAIYVSAFSWKR